MKGPVISVLTNIGSPVRISRRHPCKLLFTNGFLKPQNGTHIAVKTPYPSSTAMIK
jgi:alpha-amylase